MTLERAPLLVAAVGVLTVLLTACGSSESNPPPNVSLPTTALPYVRATGANVLPVSVGGSSICGKNGYLNEPCTSVVVCVPGTQQCQTISDILVDTGSVGLRVFSSALGFQLPQKKDSSGNAIAECAQFGIGSDWGPLATADVVLGGESAVTVPIQLINKNFAPTPSECESADSDPQSAGFNGILGIGPFNEDCGDACSSSSAVHAFFSCPADASSTSKACTAVQLPNVEQPQNIVARLPLDNNGVLLALDQVPLGGVSQVAGSLILGIATQTNNQPQGVLSYLLDEMGNFTTLFQGNSYPRSFIDSGSNGIYFPNDVQMPICPQSSSAAGFYCPSNVQVLSAINQASSGGGAATVSFPIGNADQLAQGSNVGVLELGGPSDGPFDWGLPFFYGRAIFIGIEGKSSPLGSGRYIGY